MVYSSMGTAVPTATKPSPGGIGYVNTFFIIITYPVCPKKLWRK
jgi:hypothetical protein